VKKESEEYSNFVNLEKAELHAHLNGCIPKDKILDLVQKHDVKIPPDFDIDQDLQILKPVGSLVEYFKPWLVLKLLPVGKECLIQMVDAAVEALSADSITYVEFRNSPFNICEINDISIAQSLDWLIEALCRSSEKYGVKSNLIVSLSRYNFDLTKSWELFDAIRSKNESKVIVGVDLSGDENCHIPGEVSRFFRSAKDELGMGITIHAGETGHLENIKWAIDECQADRLSHALAAAKCEKTLDIIKKNNICLEISLISNLRTGAVKKLKLHPVITFIEHRIPFVLCSDNPNVHGSSLSDEYQLFFDLTARRDLIDSMFSVQRKYCFDRGNRVYEKNRY